jgi:Rrf2 family protein
MQITRAADYAVRVMIHLASLPAGVTVRQSELTKATDVPGHFLSKVLQQLVRGRLIRSQRGAGGGYVLATAAERVSLLDVLEAVEAQAAVTNVLGGASMANLAARAKGMSYSLHEKPVWIAGVPRKVKEKRGFSN